MMNKLLIKLKQIKRDFEIHQAFRQAKRGQTTGPMSIEEAQAYLQNLIDESN